MLQIIKSKLSKFRSEEGVTALEYALLAALIAVVIVGAVTLLGTSASDAFQNVADNISDAVN